MKNILIIILVSVGIGQNIGSTNAVENVLDNLHLYASEANGEKYFDLFARNAVFFGTDISERWDKKAFQEYGMARFASGTGWTYFMKERNVFFSDDGKTAWFDEILISKKYGEYRGTGVLIFLETEWKITQYNLLLPIPNNLMKKYAAEIKNYYKQK